MSVVDQLAAKLPTFEGSIPYLYRDTVGHVTVGAGDMLPDLSAAQALPFLKPDGTMASQDDISVDFCRVMQMPFGQKYGAHVFHCADSLTLSVDEINTLLVNYIAKEETNLSSALPCYAGLPDAWKLRLLDMAYNIGIKGLVYGFPHLIAAVETGNWQACVAYCNRKQLSLARNDWTKEGFQP